MSFPTRTMKTYLDHKFEWRGVGYSQEQYIAEITEIRIMVVRINNIKGQSCT